MGNSTVEYPFKLMCVNHDTSRHHRIIPCRCVLPFWSPHWSSNKTSTARPPHHPLSILGKKCFQLCVQCMNLDTLGILSKTCWHTLSTGLNQTFSRDQSRQLSLWEVGDEVAVEASQPNKPLFLFRFGPWAEKIPLSLLKHICFHPKQYPPTAQFWGVESWLTWGPMFCPVLTQNAKIHRGYNTSMIGTHSFSPSGSQKSPFGSEKPNLKGSILNWTVALWDGLS